MSSPPGLALAIVGVLLGAVVARASAGVLTHLVWGVSTGDPITFAGAAIAVLAVASLASVIPSRRVSRLSPLLALRDRRK